MGKIHQFAKVGKAIDVHNARKRAHVNCNAWLGKSGLGFMFHPNSLWKANRIKVIISSYKLDRVVQKLRKQRLRPPYLRRNNTDTPLSADILHR